MRVCILFIALTLAVTSARRRGGEYKINIIIGHKTRDTGMSRKVHQTQCRLELLSRDSKIALHWSGAQPDSADNSDINKTIQQPLARIKTI